MFLNKRCSGHCCKAFILPWIYSPENIKERLANNPSKEEYQILTMIEYLGNNPNNFPEDLKRITPLSNFKNYGSHTHFFKCKNHCDITGDCLIYNNRPNMCRVYPNGDANWKGTCEFRGCTQRYSLWQIVQHLYKKYYIQLINKWKYNWKYKLQDYIDQRCGIDNQIITDSEGFAKLIATINKKRNV